METDTIYSSTSSFKSDWICKVDQFEKAYKDWSNGKPRYNRNDQTRNANLFM